MIISIDPGSSGGIAWSNNGIIEAEKMPDTDYGKVELLRRLRNEAYPNTEIPRCVMEKVGGFIGGRKVTKTIFCYHCHKNIIFESTEGDPGAFMFKFGDGNGFLRGTILTLGFRYDEYTPVQWMKLAGIHKDRGEGKTAWKNRLKDRAQKLFPQIKVTLSTADALVILDVAMKITSGYTQAKKELPF